MKALYRLEQVRYAYTPKQLALDIQQLDIPANRIAALLGSNGSGKSTLLKLLAFLERPQQGTLHFQGENLTNTPSMLVHRRRIGLMAQKPYLLRGTVFENVLLGLKFQSITLKWAKQQVADALERTGIISLADRQANELSGGEAQKVALARVLVLQPEVLLLDEPFTHLDQTSIEHLSHLMTDFVRQDRGSVIFTAHDHLLATTLADKVISLVSGRIVTLDG